MKPGVQVLLLLAACLWVKATGAQTLNEKLIAEDPHQLVEAARKDGNVVRGAILFHQGNINCAKCHRPSAESDRIGPDLSLMDREVTDAQIVESILQPSKTIKKGFETVTVLTVDGQLVNGIIVTDDGKSITLRDSQNVDRLITFQREEVSEIRPGTKSSMPDGLVNELKNRQQFLDLIRYVMEVRERGPTAEGNATRAVAGRQLSPQLEGLVLIGELNCIACHKSSAYPTDILAKKAPNLKWSSKWLNPQYMARFIADPQAVKPGTTMPRMLQHLDDASRKVAAEAITHYLASIGDNQYEPEPIDVQAVVRGADLFDSVGCVACHLPRDKSTVEMPVDDSIALGELAQKYNVDSLVAFLENPHLVRPSGRMPGMRLTHWEAFDIANYLLQKADPAPVAWKMNPTLAEKGELLFSELKCAACHVDLAPLNPQLASQVPLDQVKPDQGCLSDKTGRWPDFHFDDRDKELIRAAIESFPVELTDGLQIDVSLKSFNCIACHDRNGLGGVTAIRNPHFQTTNLNLGDQGRIPPTLNGVGAKLNRRWMRDVLVNGRVIRPYMKTRMPQYGEENIGHLVDLFQNTDKLSETEFATFTDRNEMRKLGLELAGNKGLNCVACHTYKNELSDTMPAVDLTEMAERLKKDWFYQYMLAPQKFSPNTVMPSFWPGGVAIRKDIAGDPAFQVEALWQYLIDGRQAGTPSGVVREPLEIVVQDEAQMLRRSYPGIGKRGIGVGYPGGVNLAYDAEQMRLAMIWKGKFVDPVGVWTGQGSGNVRPLGKPFDFAKGPELDDATNPWVADESRPPDHQFQGYILDEFRRPTFRYLFENVDVEDFFSQVVDEATHQIFLRRAVRLSSTDGRDSLSFRIASSPAIADEGNGWFSIGSEIRIRVMSNPAAGVVDVADGQQLQIPLNLAAGQAMELIIDYVWK